MRNRAWDFVKGPFSATFEWGAEYIDWCEFGATLNFCLNPKHAYIDFSLTLPRTWIRICCVPDSKDE